MNPIALITGASRGIGRGIALELARLGHDLLLNYARNVAAAQSTAADCLVAAQTAGHHVRVLTRQADIARTADRVELVNFARASFDHLDLLVNNAGVAPEVRADLLEASEESFDRLVATNLKGPYFLSQKVANWMLEDRRAPEREQPPPSPGKIIFVSSISAYTASVNRGDYCISKAGSQCSSASSPRASPGMALGVFEIRPGIIATDMTGPVQAKYDALIADGLTPIRRWGTPDDVGRAVAAIARDLLPFSTGEVINVDGGFTSASSDPGRHRRGPRTASGGCPDAPNSKKIVLLFYRCDLQSRRDERVVVSDPVRRAGGEASSPDRIWPVGLSFWRGFHPEFLSPHPRTACRPRVSALSHPADGRSGGPGRRSSTGRCCSIHLITNGSKPVGAPNPAARCGKPRRRLPPIPCGRPS